MDQMHRRVFWRADIPNVRAGWFFNADKELNGPYGTEAEAFASYKAYIVSLRLKFVKETMDD